MKTSYKLRQIFWHFAQIKIKSFHPNLLQVLNCPDAKKYIHTKQLKPPYKKVRRFSLPNLWINNNSCIAKTNITITKSQFAQSTENMMYTTNTEKYIFVLIGCIKLLSQRALNRLDWHHLIGNGRNIIWYWSSIIDSMRSKLACGIAHLTKAIHFTL